MPKKNGNFSQLSLLKEYSVDKFIIGVILMTLAIVPLLVRITALKHASPLITWSSLDTGTKYDFFTYYKLWGLAIGTALVLTFFIYKIVRKGFRIATDYTSVPMMLFFILILFSGLMAQYKSISLFGQIERHEGTVAYFCYLILFFVAANTYFSKKRIGWFFIALYPFVMINFIISILSFYGVNVFSWPIVSSLTLPADLSKGVIFDLTSGLSTISNRNYVSGFGGVATALFLTRAIFTKDSKIKIISLFFAFLSFAMMLAASSTSGFLTFTIVFIGLLVVIFWGKFRRERMTTMAVAFILFSLTFGVLNSHNSVVYRENMDFLVNIINIGSQQIGINTGKQESDRINTGQQESDRIKKTRDDYGLPVSGYSAGSGRTYIWRKTLKLIKAKPVIGYGLDTLPYYFPQDDSEKISALGNMNLIVDKPHNMYLDIAFGSGILALLVFCWLLWRHFWQNIKFFRNSPNNEKFAVSASLFVAWCAFLMQAMFNDSIIGTSVVFWILFGVNVSLLRDENCGLEPHEK